MSKKKIIDRFKLYVILILVGAVPLLGAMVALLFFVLFGDLEKQMNIVRIILFVQMIGVLLMSAGALGMKFLLHMKKRE